MYVYAIMPHVHISTVPYGIHLQLVFNYVTNYIKKVCYISFHIKIYVPFWDELKKI
jgi:hypothetical protein